MNNLSFRATFSYRLGKITAEPTRRRKKSVNNDDMKGGGEGGGQEAGANTPAAGTSSGGGMPTGGAPAQGQMQRPAGAPGQAPAGGAGQFGRPSNPAGVQQPGTPGVTAPVATPDSTSGAAAPTGVPANATGTWQGRLGQFDLTLKLTAEGEKLTGTVVTPRGENPISDGKIAGNELTFNLSFGPNTIPYRGIIEEDSLKLNASFQGQPVEGVLNRVK
jgi:hypothetical protein